MHDVLPVHQPLLEAGDHSSGKGDRGTDHDREVSEEVEALYLEDFDRSPKNHYDEKRMRKGDLHADQR